ncbi:RNA polymerase sigma-70 factor, sigma-E family [Frankia torreyi]|uniref:RNA polymerase sigma-70 factor, sigma-E family n=2 Tax=Frankia TaxID=1854 RepID=A0A0D8BFI4_9ACTN|nr:MULTISPECIES: SigE family RNA polymerase sigma factor [Frankia]KJE23048.1 RNA polymerase sigma-70 factor, sigma-E family [Frankia torreyi]KQM05211.1 RNA polymerase sigma-70 factor, sigma-E family [Frankia sp. CpI1-P]
MDEDRHREFREFFAPRLPRLLGLAYLLCGDATEAEDLTQIALARAFVAWRRVRDSDHPDAYVRRILVNANRRRFSRRRVAEDLVATVPEAAGHGGGFTAVEDRAGLAAALATLPPGQRAVVVLRYCDDLSEDQVATVLGRSVGTVKSQASRGLAKLRLHPALHSEWAESPKPPDQGRHHQQVTSAQDTAASDAAAHGTAAHEIGSMTGGSA